MFESVDGGGLPVEFEKSLGIDQGSVRLATGGCELIEDRRERVVSRGNLRMLDRRGGDARREQFEIVGRGREVAELLGNGFALFSQANVAAERTVGQRIEKPMSRARTT